MRILNVHNYYQQLGGEDIIFETESNLLVSQGHEVSQFILRNDDIDTGNKLRLLKDTLWNSEIKNQLTAKIRAERPDIVHFHNTFPMISPSAYYAVQAEGIPVVQTLHNYRILCPNGLFFREGKVCELCLGKTLSLPGIAHACYRGSKAATAATAAMTAFHTYLGTWTKAIDVFVAYSKFAQEKLVEGGLPAEKFRFKTNFLHPAPQPGDGKGNFGLFVGRLSPEKGLETLLAAWEKLGGRKTLKIIGDGPLAPVVQEAVAKNIGVEWLGKQPLDQVYELMGQASFLAFTSEWYETFGRVAIEAFAKGTPVIAANIGAVAELVEPHYNGLRFQPGDVADLYEKINWTIEHPAEMEEMRSNARKEFENRYTAKKNYLRMMEIYTEAIELKLAGQQPAVQPSGSLVF